MRQLPIHVLLREYARGAITKGEFNSRLVQSAATTAPEDVAAHLSAEQIGTLRALAASPPQSVQHAPRIFSMGMANRSEGVTGSEEQEERQLWYDGIWRWHQFFTAGHASV